MSTLTGIIIGFGAWFITRYLLAGIYTVEQNERAVKTVFGRAQRIGLARGGVDPAEAGLEPDERERYDYPELKVIPPGGPYFKFPWEKVYKVSVATETVNMAYDPEDRSANHGGTILEAVTKDQLNTGLTGQLRYRISERNLYAYLFGVKKPLAHVMGYFISVLRERIATFEAPAVVGQLTGSDLEDEGLDAARAALGPLSARDAEQLAASLDRPYTNPLPHVLILTAIVVGVATLALGLSLVIRINEAYGTIEEDEIKDHGP